MFVTRRMFEDLVPLPAPAIWARPPARGSASRRCGPVRARATVWRGMPALMGKLDVDLGRR